MTTPAIEMGAGSSSQQEGRNRQSGTERTLEMIRRGTFDEITRMELEELRDVDNLDPEVKEVRI